MRVTSGTTVAYFVTAAVAAVSGGLHHRRVAALTKPLPMVVLAGAAAAGWRHRSTTDNVLLAGAVAFSAAGDRAMFLEEFSGPATGEQPSEEQPSATQDRWLKIGASLFAGAQCCYSVLLARRGARPRLRHLLPRNAVLAESALVMARRRPALLPVLGGYGLTLATMSALSADIDHPQPSMTVGGALFLASDVTIINRRHLIADPRWRVVAETWILASYFAAQWLLINGLSRSQN